jgi:hypothetical protein
MVYDNLERIISKISETFHSKTDGYLGYFDDRHVVLVYGVYYSIEILVDGGYIVYDSKNKTTVLCNEWFWPHGELTNDKIK